MTADEYLEEPRRKNRLREMAERRIPQSTMSAPSMSVEELGKLLHELQVHQEELEIHNEELRHV